MKMKIVIIGLWFGFIMQSFYGQAQDNSKDKIHYLRYLVIKVQDGTTYKDVLTCVTDSSLQLFSNDLVIHIGQIDYIKLVKVKGADPGLVASGAFIGLEMGVVSGALAGGDTWEGMLVGALVGAVAGGATMAAISGSDRVSKIIIQGNRVKFRNLKPVLVMYTVQFSLDI